MTSASVKAPKVKVIRAKVSGKSKVPASVTYQKVTYQVASIGSKAFKNCKKLKQLTVPASVKTIGKQAFRGCSSLKTLVIKSKHLTKKSVKGSLKGSKIKKIRVKLGSAKTTRKYVRRYRKYFRKANSGRTVIIK